MTQEELKIVLEKHKKWLNCEDGGECADMHGADMHDADMYHANMRGADMHGADMHGADMHDADMYHANMRGADMHDADLSGADMHGADLSGADMRGADMRGANLDYSCWPLWCGSLDVRVDKRIFAQLAYHLCRVIVDDEECKAAQEALYPIANLFHLVDECGGLPLEKEDESHDD